MHRRRLRKTLPPAAPPCLFGTHPRWNASRDGEGRWSYEGWRRAVAHMEDTLALHGPFDGLMGFSQVGGGGGGGGGVPPVASVDRCD